MREGPIPLALGAVFFVLGVAIGVLDHGRLGLSIAVCTLFGLAIVLFAHQLVGAERGRRGALSRAMLRGWPLASLVVLALVALLFVADPRDRLVMLASAACNLTLALAMPLRAGVRWSRGARVVMAREGLLWLDARGAWLLPWESIERTRVARYWGLRALEVHIAPSGFVGRRWFAPPGDRANSMATRLETLERERVALQLTGADVLLFAYECPAGVAALHADVGAARVDRSARGAWPTARALLRAYYEGPAPTSPPFRAPSDE